MATVTYPAGNATVYPSGNDVAATASEGRRAKEQSHAAYVGAASGDYVVSGFAVSDGGGLNASVAAGEAHVTGRRIVTIAAQSVSLAPSVVNYLFVQLSFDVNGDVDDLELVSSTSITPPADSVLVGAATTNATVVTDTQNFSPTSPHQSNIIDFYNLGNLFGTTTTSVSPGGAFVNAGTLTVDRARLKGRKCEFMVMIDAQYTGGGSLSDIQLKINSVVQKSIVRNQSVGSSDNGACAFNEIFIPTIDTDTVFDVEVRDGSWDVRMIVFGIKEAP